MHRHRIRAFVTGSGDTDVPVAIFAAGQFLRYISPAVGVITSSLGPGTTTINALATWGDTTGTQLLNTSVLLDSSGNMTNLVTLDAQDAPNITAKTGTDPAVGEITVWASASAPWKLGRRVITVNTTGDMTNVNTLNGRIPSILVGKSPTSAPSTNSVMVSADSTGIVASGTPVLIDSSGNITGVLTINSTTPGSYMLGAASSTTNALVTFSGTTGKQANNASTITSTSGQLSGVTDINSTSVPSGLWVRGPAGAGNTQVAIWNGTDGRLLTSAAMQIDTSGNVTGVTTLNTVAPSTWVVGPASATSGGLAVFSGTTGKLIASGVTITASGGALSSVTAINSLTIGSTTISGLTSISGLTTLNGTTVPSGLWVQGPASATDNAVARFDATTGKLIQNSTVIVDDSGAVSGVTTLNTVDPTTWVVGPSSAVSGNIPTFSGTTGKAIADSGVGLSFILRGAATGFGFSSFVPGYGYTQRASAYKVGYVAYIPVTFPDTSGSVTITVDNTDHNGVWQLHAPTFSGYAPMGTGTTFSAGGTYATASLLVAATFTVPSGSGVGFNLSVSMTFTAGASLALGFQLWAELSN